MKTKYIFLRLEQMFLTLLFLQYLWQASFVISNSDRSFIELPLQRMKINSLYKPNHQENTFFGNLGLYKKNAGNISITSESKNNHEHERLRLFNKGDFSYTVQMQFGTPPQTLSVQADTGSSDLQVFSKKWVSIGNAYDSSKSSTYKSVYTHFEISYVSGSIKGFTSIDRVSIGNELVVEDMLFGEATSSKNMRSENNYYLDGVLGLSYQNESEIGMTFINQLYKQKKIDERMFAFDLTSDGKRGSKMIIGKPNIDFNLTQIPFNHEKNFIVDLKQFSILDFDYEKNEHKKDSVYKIQFCGDSQFKNDINSNATKMNHKTLNHNSFKNFYKESLKKISCSAIIDTGTSIILLPEKFYFPFMKKLLANRTDCNFNQKLQAYICSQYYTDCQLPLIEFQIGEAVFKIGPEHYFSASGIIEIGKQDHKGNDLILGDTFIRSVFSVFDLDNRRIGFRTDATINNRAGKKCSISRGALVGILIGISCIVIIVVFLLLQLCFSQRMQSFWSRFFSNHQYLRLDRFRNRSHRQPILANQNASENRDFTRLNISQNLPSAGTIPISINSDISINETRNFTNNDITVNEKT